MNAGLSSLLRERDFWFQLLFTFLIIQNQGVNMNVLKVWAYIIVTLPCLILPGQSPEIQTMMIIDMLQRAHCSSYLGEEVSQLEHALQTADLVRQSGGSSHLILAALLHDVGHIVADKELMGTYGARCHGGLGAEFLMNLGFSARVYEPVRYHVAAKRYLARDLKYYERISWASKCSLKNQGGPMEEKEARDFEDNLYFEPAILLRKCEDQAKIPHKEVPPLSAYEKLILEHLTEQRKEFDIDFFPESLQE